ncbi:hypothetical protein CCH79_00013872 [Gambusia affinis]|uniref:Alkylated DNA repair protein AlkB homologue 8 N-terminal domain-containing protein n=1 Tax=Gambusia affinis TaxID=33528 RepID=A0A315W603_GAMAF|nr:hypothetical protein CCH79_00013872 [Gambusia affinis]
MVVDFRRGKDPLQPLYVEGAVVEVVSSNRYLGVKMSSELTWSTNTSCWVRKVYQHLYFLSKLQRAGLGSSVPRSFYRCVNHLNVSQTMPQNDGITAMELSGRAVGEGCCVRGKPVNCSSEEELRLRRRSYATQAFSTAERCYGNECGSLANADSEQDASAALDDMQELMLSFESVVLEQRHIAGPPVPEDPDGNTA